MSLLEEDYESMYVGDDDNYGRLFDIIKSRKEVGTTTEEDTSIKTIMVDKEKEITLPDTPTNTGMLIIPSNTEVAEVMNNTKLDEQLKHDLLELHKTDQKLKQLILDDIKSLNKRIYNLELKGEKLEFGWDMYQADDVHVVQSSNPVKFVNSLAMYGFGPGKDFEEVNESTEYMFYIVIRFSAIGLNKVLDQVHFFDIMSLDDDGNLRRDRIVRYEKES